MPLIDFFTPCNALESAPLNSSPSSPMDRQHSFDSYSSKPPGPELFDIVGNLPEDILGEVISHLTTFEHLRKLITWQTVSKRWRQKLHDKSTTIYHQALLRCNVFSSLLPPTYYNNGDSGPESRFSYDTFRRAIRTHLAIRSGNLKAKPDQYICKSQTNSKVEAGPILADGFLVWLQGMICSGGYSIILKIVDLTKRAPSGAPGEESVKEMEVAEFARGGPQEDHKFQRNGYLVEWLDIHALNNMTWRALACNGGIVAYWIAGDSAITIQNLAKPSSQPWKLPICGLKPEGSKSQERYVNYLLCSKDFLVVNLSRSSTFGVYSATSNVLLHVLDLSPEVPDSLYSVFTGMLSGWRERNSCSLKIQDNYLIIACVMGMFFPPEEIILQFKSWDLKSPPTYEEPGITSPDEIRHIRNNYEDDDDDNGSDDPVVNKYPWFDLQVFQEGQEVDTFPATSLPNTYNHPKSLALRPRDFLEPISQVSLPLNLPYSGIYNPKLLFQPSNKIQLYCQDDRNPTHPIHPLKRWSYPSIPLSLEEEEEIECSKFPPVRRGYRRVLKREARMMGRLQERFPTDVNIAGVRYELTLPPAPISSGGTSKSWADYKGWKEGKKCIRLQMQPGGEHESGRSAREKHWDTDVGIKVWRKRSHFGLGVSVAAGWEGVAVLWLDRVLVWRWDLDECQGERIQEKDSRGGLVKRLKRRIRRAF